MAYKMTHPDSSQEIEVEAGQVPVMESQGWETAPQANPPAESSEKKK